MPFKVGSAGKLALVAVIFLLIGLAAGYAIKPSQVVTKTVTVTATPTAAPAAAKAGLSGEIPIGIALPESGSLAIMGKETVRAAKLAIRDFNELLAKVGAPFKFKPIVVDTRTNPEAAREAVETLINVYGCQVIVGTVSSMCLKQAMQYAIEKGVPMISPCSTSPLLAKPDIIFRMIGPDVRRGKAVAELIWHDGYRKVAVIYRDDAFGRGLAEAFKKFFTEKGGKVEMVPYNPQQVPGPEIITTLAEKVKKLGADEKTAVYIIAFEEDGKAIFKYASQNEILSSVKWYGCDGIRSKAFVPPNLPEEIAEWLANKVHFSGTFPSFAKSPLSEKYYEEYKEVYGSEPSTTYSAYAYDAAYVACLAVVLAGKYDGKSIAKIIPDVCMHYHGVTGWKILDENGDAMFQDYSIWVYKKTPEGYKFVDVGMYNGLTNTITLFESNQESG